MAAALAGPQATCPSLLGAAQSLGSCLSGPCSSPFSPQIPKICFQITWSA